MIIFFWPLEPSALDRNKKAAGDSPAARVQFRSRRQPDTQGTRAKVSPIPFAAESVVQNHFSDNVARPSGWGNLVFRQEKKR
jgi:hypothetical protein